jgi:cobalt/nickel transport system permease protein
MLFHIAAIHRIAERQSQTLWHRLTPQTRLLVALILVLAIALTPNAQWLTWALYGVAILWLVFMSQVSLGVLLQRMAIESSFVSVAVMGVLFRGGGTIVWQWGWLQVTTVGLIILGSVICKAFLSLLLLNMLALSTPIPSLLHGLQILKTPPLLVAILSSMYRYSMVLVDEFRAMHRAALSRNLMGNAQRQRAVVGNVFGSLFIRSYERGERIHQAMLARGYQGLPPTTASDQLQWQDRTAIGLSICIAVLGQAVYLAKSDLL